MKLQYLLLVLILIPLISAEIQNLPPVKQGETISLRQTCGSCSYVNISIYYPNGTKAISNAEMTDDGGGYWSYEFSETEKLGRYDYPTCGDIEGVHTCSSTEGLPYFEVTENGELTNINNNLVMYGQLGIIGLFLILGFTFSKDKWKIRSFFFMMALFMGIITLNSIRIISGASTSLSLMGNTGLIIGIITLSFMVFFILINYTIEVFNYYKKKNRKKWEVDGEEWN